MEHSTYVKNNNKRTRETHKSTHNSFGAGQSVCDSTVVLRWPCGGVAGEAFGCRNTFLPVRVFAHATMSKQRSRRNLSLAGGDDAGSDSDSAAARKRARTSGSSGAAAAAAAAAEAEQAAMFESMEQDDEYSNWFPRQTGFNTLSRSQIGKDIRDLTASTDPAPDESDDEELQSSAYVMYDAASGAHQKTRVTHQTPKALQDIWTNELLYYRWRIKKRAFEMHEIVAQRREAWESYVALRASLIEELRRFRKQREEQENVVKLLNESKVELASQVKRTQDIINLEQAKQAAAKAEVCKERQARLIAHLLRNQHHALSVLTATDGGSGAEAPAPESAPAAAPAPETTAAATTASDGQEQDTTTDGGSNNGNNADTAENGEGASAEQVSATVAADGGDSSSVAADTDETSAAPAAPAESAPDSATSAANGQAGASLQSAQSDSADHRKLRHSIETILNLPCPPELQDLYEQFTEQLEEQLATEAAEAASGEVRRTSSRIQQAEAVAAAEASELSVSPKKENTSTDVASKNPKQVVYSTIAPNFPRNEEVVVSPVVDNGDDAQILITAAFSAEQRKVLEEHMDIGKWESDKVNLSKLIAAQSQMATEMQLLHDSNRKQRKALAKRTEDCARFARQIAKVRADYAKRKRQSDSVIAELRELVQQHAEQGTAGIVVTPAVTRSRAVVEPTSEENDAAASSAAGTSPTEQAPAPSKEEDLRDQLKKHDETIRALRAELDAVRSSENVASSGDTSNDSDNSSPNSDNSTSSAEIAELRKELEASNAAKEDLQVRFDELSTQLTQYVNENSPRVRPRRNRGR